MADLRNEYIDVYLGNNNKRQIVHGIYQYDHGLKLRIHGLPTNAVWQMQYGYAGNRTSVTVFSTLEDGTVVAAIPDMLLMQPNNLTCYIYFEDEEFGLTVYEIQILITPRVKPSDGTYTPEQIDAFDQLAAELQALIDQMPDIATVAETKTYLDIT